MTDNFKVNVYSMQSCQVVNLPSLQLLIELIHVELVMVEPGISDSIHLVLCMIPRLCLERLGPYLAGNPNASQ